MLTDEAPRNTEHTEGGPQQHNGGTGIWDPGCNRRHRATLGAGVLVKRKHCGTEDYSHQREFPYRGDIVFHKFNNCSIKLARAVPSSKGVFEHA
jgi:hypothetical protein